MDVIGICYKQVTADGMYDYEVAAEHNAKVLSADVTAAELPLIEANFVAQNHVGCCLHYGMALFAKLREHNVECYIAITKEENPVTHKKTDNHVSVCYLKDGKRYIADPVETVKTGKGEYFDIPLEKYHEEQGTIWIFDPYGEYGNELFFKGFLSHPIEILEEGA